MNTNNTIIKSLYDRLTDNYSNIGRGYLLDKSYEEKKYKNSVLRDLVALLNTRSPSSAEYFDKGELTVIDYGIPDFAHYSPSNKDDQKLLAQRITKAIKYFEPRLRNPFVIIDMKTKSEGRLRVGINALLKINKANVQVTFIAEKEINSMNWDVYETI